jgi:hypothetical protein
MGVYQEASIYVTIPAAAVAPIAEAIIANKSWGDDPNLTEYIGRDPVRAIVEFIVCAEGGVPSDVDYDIDDDNGDISICTSVDGKMSFDADEVETLYAQHGATGTIDGECEGEKFRARLINGKVRRSGGETFYTDDRTDPASIAVDAALKFVRGQISELDVVTALSRARAAYQ